MPAMVSDDWVEVVLVLAPTGGDAQVASDLLRGVGSRSVVCQSMSDAVAGLERGTAALVIASEALEDGGSEQLSEALLRQPPWSDVPVILLTGILIYMIRSWKNGEWPFNESVTAIAESVSGN